jgi:hypothetical protein
MEAGDIVEYCGPNADWDGVVMEYLGPGLTSDGVSLKILAEGRIPYMYRAEEKVGISYRNIRLRTPTDVPVCAVEESGYKPDGFDAEKHRDFMKSLGG